MPAPVRASDDGTPDDGFAARLAAVLPHLSVDGATLHPGAALAAYTTFRLGGPCPLLVHCTTPTAVKSTVRVLQSAALPYRLIGGGSNLLVSDDGLPEVIVRFVSPVPDLVIAGERVSVNAGMSLDALAKACCSAGLGGMVNTSGIPGTVGGAIVGNAGAWGWQVADALESVRLLRPDGMAVERSAAELGFAYRHSDLKENGEIVLSAVFLLQRGDATALLAERADILARRAEKHPNLITHPCAGSFFRNIEPSSAADRRQAAGFFLESAGAKAMRHGGAAVFEKHANIIVKATEACRAQDVYDLSHQMAAAVLAMHGLELHPEVRALGHFDPANLG